MPYLSQNLKFKIQSFLLLALLTFNFSLLTFPVLGQGIEVTNIYDVSDEEVVDGDILISTTDGIVRATREYDVRLFGVAQLEPAIAYRRVDGTGMPVARTGIALINVSTLNGQIKTGEYITSSEIPGKGQRAGQSGYVIGVALEDFDGSTSSETAQAGEKTAQLGKIKVALKFEFAELTGSRSLNRTFDYLNNALFRNVQDPEQFTQTIRYIAAGLAVLISFAIAFATFARTIPKATEAIGRNPLAANTIRFSIMLNIAFTIGVGLVGVLAAVIIIKL